MTVIRPNAISGITSLTAQGDVINFFKSDGTLAGLEIGGARINASGVSTFTNLVVTGNASIGGTVTYMDVTNVDSVGIITAQQGIQVLANGINITGVSTVAAGTTAAPSITPTGDTDTGIFFPSADTIAFGEGGAEAARFDSSGRLMVGTTSQNTGDSKLLVSGANLNVRIESSSYPNGFSELHFTAPANNGLTAPVRTRIRFAHDEGDAGWSGSLRFFVGGFADTERMRITNSGSFRTVADSGIDVAYFTTPSAAGTAVAIFRGLRSGTAGSPGSGTDVFYVFSNGTVQNATGTYTTISDAKLKENIVDANSQWDDLKNIKIRNWNFKEETGQETHRQLGPIAQELEEVCPGLVFEVPDKDKDGNKLGTTTKGVMQSVLYMKAVKALQEAMERIEQLEAEMADVKAQLAQSPSLLTLINT